MNKPIPHATTRGTERPTAGRSAATRPGTATQDTARPHGATPHRTPRMRLTGILDEAIRNLASGTTHMCAMAVTLACLILLCTGADLASITSVQRRADAFVASGGSTTIITYNNHIDGAACDRLASLDGVIAAGAVRDSTSRLTFAALPSTGVPTFEATPGAVGVFANATTDARDTVRTTPRMMDGVWLSSDAAEPVAAHAGSTITLRDDTTARVAGVYDWPDDGRQSGFTYAAVTPMPAGDGDLFDQCWVKAWPVPNDIESLLRIVTVGDASNTQERPTISQLNTAGGRTFDATAAFRTRLTAIAPIVAGAIALMAGFLSVWLRRLELASALHCGVPKPAMIVQTLVETCAWAYVAMLLCTPVLAWMWLENTDADAHSIADTLMRVPAAAYVGVMAGALLGACLIRERSLFRYFKNR